MNVFSHDHHSAYVFTLTPEEPDNDLAARMFGMDVGEDPGTGSAAAALIGLLSEHATLATGQADFVLRQGHEMGRPCRITIQLRKDHDVLIHGGIGGHAVIVARACSTWANGPVQQKFSICHRWGCARRQFRAFLIQIETTAMQRNRAKAIAISETQERNRALMIAGCPAAAPRPHCSSFLSAPDHRRLGLRAGRQGITP